MILSVVIPTYVNTERSIDRLLLCLKGYEKQNFNNEFEIVLVDDGSTVNIKESILKYIKLVNLNIVRIKHKGMSSATNYGVKQAKGKYILLGVDDNIPYYNSIDRLIIALKDNKQENVMFMGDEYILGHTIALSEIINTKLLKGIDSDKYYKQFSKVLSKFPRITLDDIENRLSELFEFGYHSKIYSQFSDFLKNDRYMKFHWLCWRPGAIVINKEQFWKIGEYDENFDPSNWYTDIEFGYRANKLGLKTIFIDEAKFLHLDHYKFNRDNGEELRCYEFMIKKHKDLSLAMIPYLWMDKSFERYSSISERISNLFTYKEEM